MNSIVPLWIGRSFVMARIIVVFPAPLARGDTQFPFLNLNDTLLRHGCSVRDINIPNYQRRRHPLSSRHRNHSPDLSSSDANSLPVSSITSGSSLIFSRAPRRSSPVVEDSNLLGHAHDEHHPVFNEANGVPAPGCAAKLPGC